MIEERTRRIRLNGIGSFGRLWWVGLEGREELTSLAHASMTVDHISLMRSNRGKHGMIYTEL